MSRFPASQTTAMKRTRLRALASGLLCLGLGSITGSGAAFLKIGDIKGEATDADHKGWIIIESFSFGAERVPDPTSGKLGQPKPRPIAVSKELDISSPKLLETLVTGTPTVTATVEFTRANSEKVPIVYLRYELKNVLITSFDTSAESTEVPTEEFSLNFEEIKVTYIPQSIDGSPGEPVETIWVVRPEPQ